MIRASRKGEGYTYLVEKFWIVTQVLSDGNLILETRRGKTHLVEKSDPNLRRATVWDRLRYRDRFVQLSTPGHRAN